MLVVAKIGRRVALSVPGDFRIADVSQNREQPGPDRDALPVVEMAQRARVAFLYGVLRVRPVPHQGISELVGVIAQWKSRVSKTSSALLCAFVEAHHRVPSCDGFTRYRQDASGFAVLVRGLPRQTYGPGRHKPDVSILD